MVSQTITEQLQDAGQTIESLREMTGLIEEMRVCIVQVLQQGGKLLTAGNGGSAAEAMHMSEELVGRFRGDRRSLPAVSLAADGTALTCIGNDFGFDAIFSRQVLGLGVAGDLLVLFSTSGNSRNLAEAVAAARSIGMKTMALLGRDGGELAGCCDVEFIVPGTKTERIQEAHQVLVHLLLDAVEDAFTPRDFKS